MAGEGRGLNRRDFLVRAGLAGGLATVGPSLLASCGLSGGGAKENGGGKAGPIVIGLLEPLSGVYAAPGTQEMHGAQIAVDEANQKGGIWGREIKMLVEDENSNPALGQQKAQKLTEKDGVDILIGVVASNVGESVNAYAGQAGIPFIGTGIHSDTLTSSKGNKLSFRSTLGATMLSRAVGKYLLQLGKKWYFITADYSFGISGEEACKKILQAGGGELKGVDRTPLGNTDFSAQMTKVKNSGADVLVLSMYGPDTANALKAYKAFGLAGKIAVGGFLQGQEVAMALSDDENLGVWAMPWVPDNGSASAKQFAETIQKKYPGEGVSWRHWCGYNGAVAAIEGLRAAGTTAAPELVKALETIKWDGLKPDKLYFRDWDHQCIQEVFVGQSIPKKDWAFEGQYFKMIDRRKGEDVAPTKEENPDGVKNVQNGTIPTRAGYTPKVKGK